MIANFETERKYSLCTSYQLIEVFLDLNVCEVHLLYLSALGLIHPMKFLMDCHILSNCL